MLVNNGENEGILGLVAGAVFKDNGNVLSSRFIEIGLLFELYLYIRCIFDIGYAILSVKFCSLPYRKICHSSGRSIGINDNELCHASGAVNDEPYLIFTNLGKAV